MSASPTFLSTRWEAKAGDSSDTHKPANVVDAAVNKRLFLRQGAKWGLASMCTNTCPLTHKHTPRYTHNTHKDCKMLKNVLLAVIIGFYYRVTPLSSFYLWSSISENTHFMASQPTSMQLTQTKTRCPCFMGSCSIWYLPKMFFLCWGALED